MRSYWKQEDGGWRGVSLPDQTNFLFLLLQMEQERWDTTSAVGGDRCLSHRTATDDTAPLLGTAQLPRILGISLLLQPAAPSPGTVPIHTLPPSHLLFCAAVPENTRCKGGNHITLQPEKLKLIINFLQLRNPGV